jgi:hypothetical protein
MLTAVQQARKLARLAKAAIKAAKKVGHVLARAAKAVGHARRPGGKVR